MAYSDFDLKRAVTDFGLTLDENTDLFSHVAPLPVGDHLRGMFTEFVPVALGINSEKARSEMLIAPALIEAKRRAGPMVILMPGVTFDVDKSRGLAGFCDYLVTRSGIHSFVKSPVVAVVEGKREDVTTGAGQCAAEMVAVREFNEREESSHRVVHGCVTTGEAWRFLRLDGTRLTLDRSVYGGNELDKVLGILVHVFTA